MGRRIAPQPAIGRLDAYPWYPPDSQKPADSRLRRNAPPHWLLDCNRCGAFQPPACSLMMLQAAQNHSIAIWNPKCGHRQCFEENCDAAHSTVGAKSSCDRFAVRV